jgi:hypothetical protein
MNDTRLNQQQRVLDLLFGANGAGVPLPHNLELRILQFGARILGLRRAGYRVVNRTANVDGQKHSWYRLEPGSPSPRTTAVCSGKIGPGGHQPPSLFEWDRANKEVSRANEARS